MKPVTKAHIPAGTLRSPSSRRRSMRHTITTNKAVNCSVSTAIGREGNVDGTENKEYRKDQRGFFRQGSAGCTFAAVAANNLEKYGWRQVVVEPTVTSISAAIADAVDDPATSLTSLIFPRVTSVGDLVALISELDMTPGVSVERTLHESWVCVGVRVQFYGLKSWVSGFGPFSFLPKTRQSPHCDLTFRVKPRPKFERVMKPSPSGVVHLADLDMIDMSDTVFKRMWYGAFKSTKSVLGKSPDILSAAKTTFALPYESMHANGH